MLLKENAKEKIKCYFGQNNKSYYKYIFECSECGCDIKAQTHSLKTHSGKCMSCTQKGIPYKHIYNELVKNIRNLNFDLSFEEFLKFTNIKNCYYCNDTIIFNKHSKDKGKSLSRAYQLDRKDNNKGYIFDNLVVCCWECNRLKSNKFTFEEFNLLSPILKQILKNRNIKK